MLSRIAEFQSLKATIAVNSDMTRERIEIATRWGYSMSETRLTAQPFSLYITYTACPSWLTRCVVPTAVFLMHMRMKNVIISLTVDLSTTRVSS